MEIKRDQALEAVLTLLTFMGEDTSREGLTETPARFLKAWEESWGKGYKEDYKKHLKVFEQNIGEPSEIIVIKDIPIYSHCEHHIAPIVGKCHIGYLSSGKVLGLSKFARIVNVFSRRLQIQERLTSEIAEALVSGLEPLGLGVIIEVEHLCMSSRGVQVQGSITKTSVLRGNFKSDLNIKQEFLSLVCS